MTSYVLGRLSKSILVVVAVTCLVCFLPHLTGDPVQLMLPLEASRAEVEALRHALGLDAPLAVRYAHFLGGVARGDFGKSLRYGTPSLPLVLERVPATLLLASVAALCGLVISVPLGILSAMRPNTLVDRLSLALGVMGQSMPIFWLAIVLILVFSVYYRVLPAFGSGRAQHLILPTITLTLYSAARVARLTRSAMLEVLETDYSRTARAKGLSEATIV